MVNEIVKQQGSAASNAALSLGMVWIMGARGVDGLGLEHALRIAARIHKGPKAPKGDTPVSAVICCPDSEGDLAADVSEARHLAPDAIVLVFVLAPDLALARAALRAGARGLIHSEMPPGQVLRAVSVAIEGEIVLPRVLLRQWIEEQREPDLSVISARQREILQLAGEGLSNAQIAKRLYLSESTIKQHLRAAYKALEVRNRNEAFALVSRVRSGAPRNPPGGPREGPRRSSPGPTVAQPWRRRC